MGSVKSRTSGGPGNRFGRIRWSWIREAGGPGMRLAGAFPNCPDDAGSAGTGRPCQRSDFLRVGLSRPGVATGSLAAGHTATSDVGITGTWLVHLRGERHLDCACRLTPSERMNCGIAGIPAYLIDGYTATELGLYKYPYY